MNLPAMMFSEFSDNDTLPTASCNLQLLHGALPCDAWHHYYHYQSSAQYLWLAETLRALSQEADAQEAYKRAIFQDHRNQEALDGEKQVRDYITPRYAEHPSSDAAFCKTIGQAAAPATSIHDEAAGLFAAGDYATAAMRLSANIEEHPDHSDSFFLRGKCAFMRKEFTRARADFTEAIRLSHGAHDGYHRSASDAHVKRGREYAVRGELDLAVNDFTKALDLHRGNKDALKERANAYRAKGNVKMAEADEASLRA